MFRAKNNSVAAPVTTPIFPVPKADQTISDYLEEFRCTDMNTKATVGAMIITIAKVAEESKVTVPPSDLVSNCKATFRKDAPAALIKMLAEKVEDPPTEDDEVRLAIGLNLVKCTNWLQDLINAAHKKILDEGNVEGYFAMLGHTGTKASAVASLINRLSPFFPDEVNDKTFRETLAPGIWTTYRNTRVSTGRVLSDLLDDFRALGITTAGDSVEYAIIQCRDAPWDVNLSLKIPDKYKAYGCIFLEAAGTPIDKWYQGNKAKDALPATRVRGAKEIFRKYLEIKNNVADLNEFTKVSDFATPQIKDYF